MYSCVVLVTIIIDDPSFSFDTRMTEKVKVKLFSLFTEVWINSVMEINQMYPIVTDNERVLLWIKEIGRE